MYEQRRGELLQRGVIGALELSVPAEGVVLPHEDVMPEVVEERAALMRTLGAHLEPLLLTYRGDGGATGASAVIERTIKGAPLLATTTEDGFSHRLWAVTDPGELAAATDDLSRHQALIADGHHRWATYLRLREEQSGPGPWNYGLVLLIDTAEYPLQVRAIHRLLYGLPVADAAAALDGAFRVRRLEGASLTSALEVLADAAGRAAGTPSSSPATGVSTSSTAPTRSCSPARSRQGRPEPWRTLDATVLHATMLDHLWHVPDSPEHIAYIHDAEAAVEQAERRGGTAVLMHPVREEVVRDLRAPGRDHAPQVDVVRPEARDRSGAAQPHPGLNAERAAPRGWGAALPCVAAHSAGVRLSGCPAQRPSPSARSSGRASSAAASPLSWSPPSTSASFPALSSAPSAPSAPSFSSTSST